MPCISPIRLGQSSTNYFTSSVRGQYLPSLSSPCSPPASSYAHRLDEMRCSRSGWMSGRDPHRFVDYDNGQTILHCIHLAPQSEAGCTGFLPRVGAPGLRTAGGLCVTTKPREALAVLLVTKARLCFPGSRQLPGRGCRPIPRSSHRLTVVAAQAHLPMRSKALRAAIRTVPMESPGWYRPAKMQWTLAKPHAKVISRKLAGGKPSFEDRTPVLLGHFS